MTILDSSSWVEFLQDTALADQYADAIAKPDELRVPAVILSEVYRFVLREAGEALAIQAAGLLCRSPVIDLDAGLAIRAATLGHAHGLPLADSIIYATALSLDAELWTQDADFEGLPHVKYFAKSNG